MAEDGSEVGWFNRGKQNCSCIVKFKYKGNSQSSVSDYLSHFTDILQLGKFGKFFVNKK